jgi:hypothetical protein
VRAQSNKIPFSLESQEMGIYFTSVTNEARAHAFIKKYALCCYACEYSELRKREEFNRSPY